MKIFSKKEFKISTEELSENHFEVHPIWCEYYEPFEIDEIVRWWGIDKEWLWSIIEPSLEGDRHMHPYYIIPTDIELPKHEFIYLKTSLQTASGYHMNGFFSIVKEGDKQEITSLTIFMNKNSFHFYKNSLFDDENTENLQALSQEVNIEVKDLQLFNFETGLKMFKEGISSGVFTFPTI